MNAVERNFSDWSPVRPVPTRILNPNASEASYKPKQRSYRKTKPISFFRGILSGHPLPVLLYIYLSGVGRFVAQRKRINNFDLTNITIKRVNYTVKKKHYDAYSSQRHAKFLIQELGKVLD